MKKYVHVAEVNQQRCLEESGQWLENVDQTHLELAYVKLVLQKSLGLVAKPCLFISRLVVLLHVVSHFILG